MNFSRYITNRLVYALRARGFDSEPYFSSMNEIIITYRSAIKKVQPSGPYFMCGYSFGSILAFEIAKRMEAAGDKVKFLGVIDQPPHFKLRARGYDRYECVLTIAFFLGLMEEKYAYEILPKARQQTHDEVLSHIFEIAQPARLTELDMTRNRLDNWAKFVYQLKVIARDYNPEGVARDMDVFWTELLVGIVKARNKKEWREDYIGKWQNFVDGNIRFHKYKGTHRTIISPPFLKGFWEKFKKALSSREVGIIKGLDIRA
jgi:thioesterase domain-containing protein